jgi:RNA polymerase sigma-70 factor (ECF subfamily)
MTPPSSAAAPAAPRLQLQAGDLARRSEGTTREMIDGGAEDDDATLVRRTLAGDANAFGSLVDRHGPPCLRFAARMLGNREDAEDATQETLMRGYQSLASYDGRTSFRTWVFAILVNRCRTAMLRRARRERRVQTDAEHVARASVASRIDDLHIEIEVARALERLSAPLREAFLLKHVEQLEYTEIAAITGQRLSALKMRVRRACAQLAVALRELEHG